MANTETRYFTPAEANALLPLISGRLDEISEAVRRARSLADGAEHVEGAHEAVRVRMAELQARVERLLDDIQAEGVHVKGVEPGLLDFPALRQGTEVYLCWHEGEERVEHWHPLHTGFVGRQRVDETDLGIWEWCN